MQIICPNCNHVAQVDGARIPKKAMFVQCSKCGARFPFNKAAGASPLQLDKDVFRCPKCNAVQERGDMCLYCGLVFEKYVRAEAERPGQTLTANQPDGHQSGSYRQDISGELPGGRQDKPAPPVSIGKYLWIFALSYIGLMIIAAIVLFFLNIKRGSGVNTGIFIGTAVFSLGRFVKDNGRLWDAQQKRRLIIGMISVSLAYDLLISLVAIPNASGTTFLFAMLFAFAFVGILRLLGLWLFMGPMANRIFGKSIISDT